jgi:hypothetical protein
MSRVQIISPGEDLSEAALEFHEFTFVDVGHDIPKRTIGLIRFGEGLAAVGMVEKGAAVATHRRRFRASLIEEIDPVLGLNELRAHMPARLRRHLRYGLLAERTSDACLEALLQVEPGLTSHVDMLRARLREPEFRRRGYETPALEKDAVGLALDFQGIEREDLLGWSPDARPESFLRGLNQAVLREDQILNHDLGVFSDWDIVDRSAVGAVFFGRNGAEVTVVNVNRTPVEQTLGVDLVYFHEQFRSFVLVQYKRLEDDRDSDMGAVYRPDENLEGELTLMRAVVPTPPDPVDEWSYRLGPGVSYLKLCKSVQFDPRSKDLIPGMYLPLEYFDACEPTAVGPRGGRAYGYSTVPRHFNNTQFIDLVQGGWIGSNGTLSDELQQLVEELVESGRSVLLASGSGVHRNRPRAAYR